VADHSPADELGSLLDKARQYQRSDPLVPAGDHNAYIAGCALARQVTLHADAVLTLVRAENAAAASASLRAEFEAWLDLRYLLLHGDRKWNAVKCYTFANLELLAYLEECNEPSERRAPVESQIAALRTHHREVVEEVERERTRRSRYWTGMSRTKQLSEVAKVRRTRGQEFLDTAYKLQSWDAHHIMTLIKDVRSVTKVSETGEVRLEVGFGFGPPSTLGDENQLLAHAYEMLADAWQLMREFFGIPE
jgi:hypothetical protein